MILSSDQIKKEIQDIWPSFQWDFPKNPFWSAIPDNMMPRIIKECSVKHMVIIPHIWECENYSGKWRTNVQTFQYDLWQSGEYRPEWRWYVMDAEGIEDGILGKGDHSLNILRLESRIVLFEPQTDQISRDFKTFTPLVMDG